MRRLLLAAMTAALLISACGSGAGGSVDEDDLTDEPTTDPDAPVSSDDTPVPTDEADPADGDFVMGEATVESIDVLTLESFPVQIHAVVRGVVGDSCTELGMISTRQEDDTFIITIPTTRDPDAICDQSATTFEETIPLDVVGLAAGTYTVEANGVTATFTLSMDNGAVDGTIEPDDTDQMMSKYQYGLANVTGAEVYVKADSIEVFIVGWLPNPCTEVYNIEEEQSGSLIKLTVETRADMEVMCIQVIEDFSTTYKLEEMPKSGHYTVLINEQSVEFDVP
jgi:hypothetical protein